MNNPPKVAGYFSFYFVTKHYWGGWTNLCGDIYDVFCFYVREDICFYVSMDCGGMRECAGLFCPYSTQGFGYFLFYG